MNLLAHLHLSDGHSPARTAGNVLADFMRRLGETSHDPEFLAGVRLHRAIDGFTERHPLVRTARQCISAPRRRLAGVIVDVAFDYCLSRQWAHFSAVPLRDHIAARTAVMRNYLAGRAPALGTLLDRAVREEWLLAYGTLAGVRETFRRVSRRSRAAAGLPGAEQEIALHGERLQHAFAEFYPQLIAFVRSAAAAGPFTPD